MEKRLDITNLLEIGKIQNELELERALIADRKLRVLSKEDQKYKVIRKKLRDLIEDYENKNWSSTSTITEAKIQESDSAEVTAEKERLFIHNRKELIRKKLKLLNLTQQSLGAVLGHNSKSYMSELMNGVSPFSLKDLIVINRLLNIDFANLIPTFLNQSDLEKITASIQKLANPKLKLIKDDFELA